MNARTVLSALLLLALCWGRAAWADPQFRILASEAPQAVQIISGKSIILSSEQSIARVSLAAPEQAELVLLSPRQIYITGKKTGVTNLTLWGPGDRVMSVYDLEIVPDVTQLKHMLHTVLPGEPNIKVLSSGSSVTLTGEVSSAANLSTALALGEAAAPGKLVNLLRVGGVQQVMLEVRVAEMSRSVTKRLGFNFQFISGNDVVYSFLNNLTKLDDDGKTVLTDNVNIAGSSSLGGHNSLNYFVDALKANGLLKILAEPNLICLSGQSAEFLAGGEVPIPVPQGLGAVGIDYKPFGVGLKFTPTVLDSGTINIKVEPEVSDLDYSRSISVGSYVVPSITSRRASTTVELGNGQSFAIAGLIKDSMRENVNKFPALGDVPVLGSLFRSSDFQKNESELIIIVTPHLVKPLDMAKQTLPTDGFQEPDDFEFYLLGLMQGRGSKPASATGLGPSAAAPSAQAAGFDGEFGHIMPR